MRLVFSPHETEQLEAAQAALLDGFLGWARRSGRTAERVCAEAALDYKAGADGLLGRWTAGTLTYLCADWLPSKITLPEADWPRVPETLHSWVDHLHDEGLLDRRSDPPAALHRAVDAAADDFQAAMADPTRYGLAKFWMTTMLRHGVDLDDEAQRDAFFEDLHAGKLDVDMSVPERIADRQVAEATADAPSLPLVAAPPRDDLAKQAAATAVVEQLHRFVTRLGAGLPLDSLGDDDGWYAWARAARLVRPVNGRLVPVKRAAADLRDPLALWDRAFDALGRLGPVWRDAGRSPVTDDLDAALLGLLAPLGTDGTLPRLALAGYLWDSAADTYDVSDPAAADRLRRALDRDVRRALDALGDLGAVRAFTADDPDVREDLDDLAGELGAAPDPVLVELTDLGTRGLTRLARAHGWTAPTVEDLAGETAEVLVATIADHDADLAEAAIDAWVTARAPGEARAELDELAARTDDAVHRDLAVRARARLGSGRG